MYIDKYWGNYIGGTDDSLTLLGYLLEKGKEELSLEEIFSDLGLDKQDWDFRSTEEVSFTDSEGMEYDFYYAIDLITDLAALILECSVNGYLSPGELMGDDDELKVSITLTDDEKTALNDALLDFINNPLEYDLHEMMDDDEMREMAEECEELRSELF
ncbi:MAG: hypothetical protein J5517_08130 [Eubacterium sp.]|nr:hypothetical protein [Eubacterium sp.]